MRQGLIAARLSTKRRPLIGLASGRFNVRTRARDNSRAGLHTPNAPNYQFSKSRLPGTTTWQSSLLGRAAVASHRTVLSRGEACDPKVAPVSSHSKEHPRTALPTCLDPLSRTGTGGVGRRLGWASLAAALVGAALLGKALNLPGVARRSSAREDFSSSVGRPQAGAWGPANEVVETTDLAALPGAGLEGSAGSTWLPSTGVFIPDGRSPSIPRRWNFHRRTEASWWQAHRLDDPIGSAHNARARAGPPLAVRGSWSTPSTAFGRLEGPLEQRVAGVMCSTR